MDAVLIVTEPGISALHDLRRLVTVCRRFNVQIFVVINRFDLADEFCTRIEDYCAEEGIPTTGKIPFDPEVVAAVRSGRPATRIDSPAAKALRALRDNLFIELGLS